MFNSAIPWTVVCQAPLSVGVLRQEYWSALPISFPGDLPDPGIQLVFPAWYADSLPLGHLGSPYLIMFIYLLSDGHLACLHLLVSRNNITASITVQVSV